MHHVNSINLGRMEEADIDARSHVSYAKHSELGKIKIITGSMRTLEGLKWCVEYGTLPTIGTRVLDLINGSNVQDVFSWTARNAPFPSFCPPVTQTNTQLSIDFFKQMDDMGTQAYFDLQQSNF